jgi:hypothetical protein
MRALSFGIVCIAVVPYVVDRVVDPATGASDAVLIVFVTLSHAIGLAAIYTTFDR